MFRRLTHLHKNCMMVHFSFQYCWNITQNRFLGSFPLVHNSSYCCIWADAPARTVGWRDPGFIHTSFLKELWPNAVYVVSLFLHMILILGVNSSKLGFGPSFMQRSSTSFVLHLYVHNINLSIILFEHKFLLFSQNFVKISIHKLLNFFSYFINNNQWANP